MAIRSVDLMILYSKTADVEKAQQVEQQQGRINNENVTANEVKRKEVEQSKVQESPEEAESGKIREEPERKRGQQDGSGGREQQEEGGPEGENTDRFRISPHSGTIDITI